MENYIGPYWSDGKWQESVEFGDTEPLSLVDAASRLHDSAYAHYKDEQHRIAADEIYSETLKSLKEKYASLADVPLYGNYTKNRALEFGSNALQGFKYGGVAGALGSLVYTGVKGIVRLNDLIHNGGKYKSDVLAYYDTDPKKITAVKVSRPDIPIVKPIAPKTIASEEYEMFKKNKTAPTPPPRKPLEIPEAAAPALYRPLKKKRVRPISAADLELYLQYNPGARLKVMEWLQKHNKTFP